MSEAGTEGLFRRLGRGKRAAARSRQQALGGERWFQCWEGTPATKLVLAGAEQWTTTALKIPFWESVHGEPLGYWRRAAPPPADDRGLPIAGDRGAWARVAREAAGRSFGGGAWSHPSPRSAAGPGFSGVVPAYRRWTSVGSRRPTPCRSWRSYAPGVSRPVSRGVFSGRPVAAFCKHAATTCRPGLGQVRARPLAENSILRSGGRARARAAGRGPGRPDTGRCRWTRWGGLTATAH